MLRVLLGARLRRLREAAGIFAEKAGHELRASRSEISRMGTGRAGFKLRDIGDLLTLCGVPDEKQLASAVYLDQRADAGHYPEVVDQLSGEALTPAGTIGFIEQVAREA